MNIIEKNYSLNGDLKTRSKTTRIILHHAAASNCSADDVDRWHKNNSWTCIGYHFFVRKDGSIYRGRKESAVGAHAENNNSDSIGICAEGNFENETMSEAQKNALIELVGYLKGKYGISKVQRHKDVNATACPGKNYPFDEIINLSNNNNNNNNNKDIFNDGKINCIYDIQEWLKNTYGFNIAQDNIYGEDTHKKLVMAYQTELNNQFGAGLVVDGVFGNNTYNACINIRKGAEGNITKLIQMMLFIKNYNINIDGIFGNATANVLKQFQSDNGLSSDGICGKNTFQILFK